MTLSNLSEYQEGELNKPVKSKMIEAVPVKKNNRGDFVIGTAKRYSILIDKGIRKEDAAALRKEIAEADMKDNDRAKLLDRIKFF